MIKNRPFLLWTILIPPLFAVPVFSANAITGLSCEKKQGAVQVLIALADSSGAECTIHFPNVTVSVPGATIDTGKIKPVEGVGIVDSLVWVQDKESARISFRVSREIEAPRVVYNADRHLLAITVMPKHATAGSEMMLGSIGTIVLDAGHGGMDPGAIGATGKKEKDVVLAITLDLYDLLKKEKDLKVFLVRDKDLFVPLSDRTKMANQRHADLFISIHANAVPGSQKKKETTRGYKVYFLSQSKNEEDKLAAMRENAVIKLEEKPQHYNALKNVLIDLEGNEYLAESQELCIMLDRQFNKQLRGKIVRQQHGIGQANFWVLNGAYMPSILIETGYITSAAEERLLSDPSTQKAIAKAVYDGVLSFKKKYEAGL
jgi:N-acetylmuramoyl-L-alanine amidase